GACSGSGGCSAASATAGAVIAAAAGAEGVSAEAAGSPAVAAHSEEAAPREVGDERIHAGTEATHQRRHPGGGEADQRRIRGGGGPQRRPLPFHRAAVGRGPRTPGAGGPLAPAHGAAFHRDLSAPARDLHLAGAALQLRASAAFGV